MMLEMVKSEVTRILMTVQIRSAEELQAVEEPQKPSNVQYQHADFAGANTEDPEQAALEAQQPMATADADNGGQPFVRNMQKVGRNDPCPCGSGKKYKHCHGRLT